MPHAADQLIARLLAHRAVARDDPSVTRLLTDEPLRSDVEQRLAACGLRLVEHPYADHLTVALDRRVEEAVFGGDGTWLTTNARLPRDAIALLVVLWALLILPKRQRQIERRDATEDAAQTQLFAEERPIPRGEEVGEVVSERTLIADFGDKLGKKTRINMNLTLLARLGFIHRRKGEVREGPLLDLLLDYATVAPRIIDGALADLLAGRRAAATQQGATGGETAAADAPADGGEATTAAEPLTAPLAAPAPPAAGELGSGEPDSRETGSGETS